MSRGDHTLEILATMRETDAIVAYMSANHPDQGSTVAPSTVAPDPVEAVLIRIQRRSPERGLAPAGARLLSLAIAAPIFVWLVITEPLSRLERRWAMGK